MPPAVSSEVIGLKIVGIGTGTQAFSMTMSERRSLSSKVARKVPSLAWSAFLSWPRTPDTVRMAAPSNLATSSDELNMSFTNAVFLCTLKGVPTSLSFLTMLRLASSSSTTPVAEMRKVRLPSDW